MSTPNSSHEYAQLPLVRLEEPLQRKRKASPNHQIEETFARLRQLQDELNEKLYAHPTQRPVIQSPACAAEILNFFIGSLDHEELWVIVMDTRNRVKCLVQLYKGSVNSSSVRIAEVFRQAVIENSPAVIVGHNHPSGDITPSPEDINVTRAMFQAGKLLDIDLLDHLIVSQGRFFSLKERGLGFS